MRRGALVFAALLAATGISCRPHTPARLPAWRYSVLSHQVSASFDLRFVLDAEPGCRARLLFGAPDGEREFYVEFGPTGLVVGDIGNGTQTTTAASPILLRRLVGRQMVYQQRPHRWSLSADGELLAWGDDPPVVGEPIRFGAVGGALAPRKVRFQTVQGACFADSFMRTSKDPTSWAEVAGKWELNVVRNPLLSANAFHYSGSGSPKAVAVVGERFWSDFEATLACKPAAKGAVGMYLCYRGPKEYYLFRWTARDSQRPVKQLIERRGDEERVLAEVAGGYSPGEWYTFSALLGSGWVRLTVDDTRVFLVRDPGLTYGKVGLHVEGDTPAVFDDVAVESRPARFLVPDRGRHSGWLSTGGEWLPVMPARWDDNGRTGGVVVNARRQASLLWAQPFGRNYAVSSRLGPWRSGVLGLLFRYADELNHYSVRWRKASVPQLQLCRTRNGKTEVLAEVPVREDGRPHQLGVESEGGKIIVRVDGKAVLCTADFAFFGERVGLLAEGVSPGSFSELICEALPAPEPVGESANLAFAAEPGQMRNWSGAGSDWRGVAYSATEGVGRPTTLWWHRSHFHGDVRIDLHMKAPLRKGEVGLVVNGDGFDFKKGAMVRVYPAGVSSEDPRGKAQELVAEFRLNGERIRTAPLAWQAGPRTLSLRRAGGMLILFLGDEPVFTVPAVESGIGRRIAWYVVDAPVTLKDINVYSRTLINYTFRSAPTDWRVGGGIWEVANRWQCDPRWSFFSGRCPHIRPTDKVPPSPTGSRADLVVLWNKRPLRGDFTIEYYIGEMMTRELGARYEYARDMNITVCADGSDLTSGYSFLFGGFGNTKSCLYRRGVEWWKKPGLVINARALHRKWYHIKVSRRGGTLEVRVDDTLVVSKTDPEPLGDGRFAIWTYNNGIIVARVRVSADEIGPLDSPDRVWQPTVKSVYSDEGERQNGN